MTFFASDAFASTYFAKLPSELIDHIRSFNFDHAARTIQTKTKYYLKFKVKIISDLFVFAYSKCSLSTTMANYSLFYRNRLLNRKDVFNACLACKCCERHQINKPKEFVAWEETEFHNTQETPCSCPCRHISRAMCCDLIN